MDNYVDYLMAGILAQTVIFGSTQTGVGLAEDMSGMIDRFSPCPWPARPCCRPHPVGHGRNLFVVILMLVVGTLVRVPVPRRGRARDRVALALAFGLAFSGSRPSSACRSATSSRPRRPRFVWVFPLVFASSAFVPVESMPGWLQSFTRINPVTITVNALRALTLGGPTTTPLLQSLAWIAGILLVFVPLAVNRYRRAAG